MNAFEAYETYLSIKQHFTQKSYDFHKYNGKVNTSVSRFESRPDRAFFYKISKKYPKDKLIDFFVANFVANPFSWIGDMMDDYSEEVYIDWKKKIESLTYYFSEECDAMLHWAEMNSYKFNDLFKINGSDHPIIVKMSLQRVLSFESFIILNRIFSFGQNFDRKMEDVIWKEFWFKICKYETFLNNIDRKKCKQILRNKIETDYPHVV